MRYPYLTMLFVLLAAAISSVVAFNYLTDAFGIYGADSAEKLSRIDQFYHMRSSKPLILLNKKPQKLIIGSSRTARLVPSMSGYNDYYNAAIPGATLREIQDLIEFAHYNNPLDTLIIGLDFEAYLSTSADYKLGFNTDLVNARNAVSRTAHTVAAHKRTLFSSVSLEASLDARQSKPSATRPSYLPDGSWFRNQKSNIGPFGFSLVSKQKVETFKTYQESALNLTNLSATLEFCYSNTINCQIFITPVHLFHLELFEAAQLLERWRDWHWQIVRINEGLASEHNATPVNIWAFNAFRPAVTEPIRKPDTLDSPWFSDNLHFRPKFGDVMMRAMLSGVVPEGVTRLTATNTDLYLQNVNTLWGEYRERDKKVIQRLKKGLGIQDNSHALNFQ